MPDIRLPPFVPEDRAMVNVSNATVFPSLALPQDEAQSLLIGFFENSPLMMGVVELLDDDFRQLHSNTATASFFSTTPDKLHGRCAREFGLPPDIVRTWLKHYREAEETDAPVRFEYPHPTETGDRHFAVRVFCITPSGAVPRRFAYIIEDVTEQRRLEREAEEARRTRAVEERATEILQSIPDGFFAVDREWRFTYLNDQAVNLIQRPLEDLLGLNMWDLYPGAADTDVFRAFQQYMRDGSTVETDVFFPPDGRWFRVRAHPAESGMSVFFCDVTEKHRADEVQQENMAILRLLDEAAPDLMWMSDGEGRVLYVNRYWETYTGRTIEDVNRTGWLDLFHPDDRERLARGWTESALSGEITENECRLRHRDGDYRWVWGRAVPIMGDDGTIVRWVGVCTDITERKSLEEALLTQREAAERERRRLRAVLDALPVGLFLSDATGRILEVNDVARSIWGFDAPLCETPDAYSKEYRGWWPKTGQQVQSHEWGLSRALQTGERVLGEEVDIESRDGHRKTILNFALPIPGHAGEVEGGVVVIVDITERKAMEEALREQAEALLVADQAKDAFLAMLGHELRNPLGVIGNTTELMRLTTREQPDLEETHGILRQEVTHMARMVDDLLDVSRITMGRLSLKMEPVDFAGVVRRAVECAAGFTESCRQTVTLTVPDRPLMVDGDPARLQQVVGNLLHNAAKYTPAGGRIWVDVEADEAGVLLRVRDDGEGIEPALLPNVFDLFTQSAQTIDRSQGGLGIGLTLVKSLVELQGGSVSAHSAGTGTGSEFVVRLPALARKDDGAETSGGPALPQRPLRILVVEDNPMARRTLEQVLKVEGHTVTSVGDGPSALEAARKSVPDVVLLDVGLPCIDGYEVARRMRQDPLLAGTLLVAVTGYGQDADRKQSREAGIDEHLVKPLDFNILHTLLERSRANPA